jgi:3-dehydroquinate dehydratase II
MNILVIHGPNLDLLGRREPGIYGIASLDEIDTRIMELAEELEVEIETVQLSGEGEMVRRIGACIDAVDGIVINPAAYTHTSVAIRDAIAATGLPVVEVHISNTANREEFRHHSLTAPVCKGQIIGFGVDSYLLGLRGLVGIISRGA